MGGELVRPTKCCAIGSYECQVPMPLNGRLQSIDYCIADIVAALNAANIITVASCCGHDKKDASVMLQDGRELHIDKKEVVRWWENRKFHDQTINVLREVTQALNTTPTEDV